MDIEEAVEIVLKGKPWIHCKHCKGSGNIDQPVGVGGSSHVYTASDSLIASVGGGGGGGGASCSMPVTGGNGYASGGAWSMGDGMTTFAGPGGGVGGSDACRCDNCKGVGGFLREEYVQACMTLDKKLPTRPEPSSDGEPGEDDCLVLTIT